VVVVAAAAAKRSSLEKVVQMSQKCHPVGSVQNQILHLENNGLLLV